MPEESRSAEEMIADVVARCGVAKELLRYDKERLKKVVGRLEAAGVRQGQIAEAIGMSRASLWAMLKE